MKITRTGWQALLIAAVAYPTSVPGRTDAGLSQPAEPLVARKGDTAAMRIHVGDTGIKCLRLPCPSRGVFLPHNPLHKGRGALLYTDKDGASPPPPMVGGATDLAAITTAWNKRQCLAIEGRLISGVEDRPVLRVDKIVGSCRGPQE